MSSGGDGSAASDWPTDLPGTRFRDIRWFDEVGSTNTDLMSAARDGAPEGSVMIADVQIAGRGRLGRRWVGESGTSLMMSILLRPPGRSFGTESCDIDHLGIRALGHHRVYGRGRSEAPAEVAERSRR